MPDVLPRGGIWSLTKQSESFIVASFVAEVRRSDDGNYRAIVSNAATRDGRSILSIAFISYWVMVGATLLVSASSLITLPLTRGTIGYAEVAVLVQQT